MTEPYNLTAAEASALIGARELSPMELVESCLGRIEALEPDLKAWVTVDRRGALEAARLAEGEIRRGRPRSPLHGIPVGVKDIYYTAGLRTTAGSRVYADLVPGYDAAAVARLKAAGAIILGKTVTTEFACYDPPPTRNPWDPSRTPGGSSSGSAVAVAARMCPLALGSQTAGSVLRPALYNGVVGLKPTYGRISVFGVIPVSFTLDTLGTFTRTVEDAALLLNVLAGRDPRDPYSSDRTVPDYRQALEAPPQPLRVGLVRQFFFQKASKEVSEHTEEVAGRLSRAGARVEEVDLPTDFQDIYPVHRTIMIAELAAWHRDLYRQQQDQYAPGLTELVEAGLKVGAVDYLKALERLRTFREQMAALAASWDVLLTPGTPAPAPDSSTTGDPVFQTPWTAAGLPSISLPTGLSAGGLPLGVQLVAPPFAEARLLAAARWCETVVGAALTPPGAA